MANGNSLKVFIYTHDYINSNKEYIKQPGLIYTFSYTCLFVAWFDYYTTILRVYMIDLTTDQLTFHLNSLLERFQFPHPEDHIHRALVIAFSALIFIINEMEDTARMLLNLEYQH